MQEGDPASPASRVHLGGIRLSLVIRADLAQVGPAAVIRGAVHVARPGQSGMRGFLLSVSDARESGRDAVLCLQLRTVACMRSS